MFRGRWSRQPYSRGGGKILAIATIHLRPFVGRVIQNEFADGGIAVVDIDALVGHGIVIDYIVDGGFAAIDLVSIGEQSQKLTEDLYFIDEPVITIQRPLATHITVRSKTHEATAELSGVLPENTIEKLIEINEGNEDVCQTVADRLLEKYGREQRSVSGVVDLVVTTKFKEQMRIVVPVANIDEFMTLQKKEHDLASSTTRVTFGDAIPSQDEILSRILEELE